MAELRTARDAVMLADMVELRLDAVADVDVAGALEGRRAPVIVTCRPGWEGGPFTGSEEERRRLLARALDLGAEYVDIEWQALQHDGAAGFRELISMHPRRVVVSMHDFRGVPSDLGGRAAAMRRTGAALIKVAVTAARLTDTLPLIEIARGGNAVVIGMGEPGVPSRLLASRFGSRWTYGGDRVAPGQLPVKQMVEQFRYREIGLGTAVYGVVGDNVMHSLSPVMHNATFAAAGMDAAYVPLRAADMADFLAFADALDIRGASVTVPFKVEAFGAAVSSDDLTRAAGAANTLRRRHREWEATNTDVAGFLEPLDAIAAESGWVLQDVRASVLGAGGAARAVVVALVSRGARVTVHARRREEAERLAIELHVHAGTWPPAPRSWDLLVNTTPLGGATSREASPLPGGPFDGRLVYDLTYGPGESLLRREARRAGCRTLDGLPMLIAQAERQFEWWTGARPPYGVMGCAVRPQVEPSACAATRE